MALTSGMAKMSSTTNTPLDAIVLTNNNNSGHVSLDTNLSQVSQLTFNCSVADSSLASDHTCEYPTSSVSQALLFTSHRLGKLSTVPAMTTTTTSATTAAGLGKFLSDQSNPHRQQQQPKEKNRITSFTNSSRDSSANTHVTPPSHSAGCSISDFMVRSNNSPSPTKSRATDKAPFCAKTGELDESYFSFPSSFKVQSLYNDEDSEASSATAHQLNGDVGGPLPRGETKHKFLYEDDSNESESIIQYQKEMKGHHHRMNHKKVVVPTSLYYYDEDSSCDKKTIPPNNDEAFTTESTLKARPDSPDFIDSETVPCRRHENVPREHPLSKSLYHDEDDAPTSPEVTDHKAIQIYYEYGDTPDYPETPPITTKVDPSISNNNSNGTNCLRNKRERRGSVGSRSSRRRSVGGGSGSKRSSPRIGRRASVGSTADSDKNSRFYTPRERRGSMSSKSSHQQRSSSSSAVKRSSSHSTNTMKSNCSSQKKHGNSVDATDIAGPNSRKHSLQGRSASAGRHRRRERKPSINDSKESKDNKKSRSSRRERRASMGSFHTVSSSGDRLLSTGSHLSKNMTPIRSSQRPSLDNSNNSNTFDTDSNGGGGSAHQLLATSSNKESKCRKASRSRERKKGQKSTSRSRSRSQSRVDVPPPSAEQSRGRERRLSIGSVLSLSSDSLKMTLSRMGIHKHHHQPQQEEYRHINSNKPGQHYLVPTSVTPKRRGERRTHRSSPLAEESVIVPSAQVQSSSLDQQPVTLQDKEGHCLVMGVAKNDKRQRSHSMSLGPVRNKGHDHDGKFENNRCENQGSLVGLLTVITPQQQSSAALHTETDRLRAAYEWYNRCGRPSRDQFKKRMEKLPESYRSSIFSINDIDLLPWDSTGAWVDPMRSLLFLYADWGGGSTRSKDSFEDEFLFPRQINSYKSCRSATTVTNPNTGNANGPPLTGSLVMIPLVAAAGPKRDRRQRRNSM